MKLLIDLDTGEPAIGIDGNLQDGDDNRGFEQYLDILYNTPVGTEQIFANWGFPYQKIMSVSHLPNWESMVKFAIVETLQVEPLVSAINSLKLERDGSDLTVKINVRGTNGETAETEVRLSR